MNYKMYLYIFFVFLSIYGISCLNYEKFIKPNKVIETRVFLMILSIISGYILTNFVVDFISLDKIL